MNHDDWRHLFLSVVESIDRLTEQVEKSMNELDCKLHLVHDEIADIADCLTGEKE
jgi:hypothetical protein